MKRLLKRHQCLFFTALSLSFNNLLTKKFRTLLTAFAGSIGIIGVGLVLALSNGFNTYMHDMENETFAKFPLIVTESFVNIRNIVEESFNPASEGMIGWFEESIHENKITEDYVTYIKDVVEPQANFVTYQYAHSKYFANMVKSGDKMTVLEHRNEPFEQGISLTNSAFIRESNYTSKVFEDKFDVLAGRMFDDDKNEAVLIIDNMNKVSEGVLKFLGINTKGADEIDYEKIVGLKFKNMHVDNYYIKTNSKTPEEMYRKPEIGDNFVSEISEKSYRDDKNQEIVITGVVRAKSDFTTDMPGIYYSRNVEKDRLKMNYLLESEVIVSQMLLLSQKKSAIKGLDAITAAAALGLKTEPLVINVYPKDEVNKVQLAELLTAYNDNISNELDHIKHSDITDVAVDIVKEIMKLVTVVLVMFSSISLIVSSVMIGIITYTSVLERTKEIGILRSVGARKRDISRVFNSETVIIGLISGIIGIVLAYAFSPLLSLVIENISGVPNILRLNPLHALLLVLISMTLTFLAGLIPAKIAANKDPVAALKNE